MCGKTKKTFLALIIFMVTTGFQTNQHSIMLGTIYSTIITAKEKKGSLLPFEEKILRQILKEQEKEGRETETSRHHFDLDPKYRQSGQRDPFAPLMTDSSTGSKKRNPRKSRKKSASRQVKKTKYFREFGKEVDSLKPIPVELYRKIGEGYPELYADLERYGSLFGRKADLRKLTINTYFKKVREYEKLIKKANLIGKKTVKTSLQAKLRAMRLVGVIWGGPDPVALVETSGNKGHTVKKGMLMGPNFGVVHSINTNHIAILERNRDFRGGIESKAREIQLAKKPQLKRGES